MTTYRRLSGPAAVEQLPALQEVYGAVFSQPPYNEGPEMVGQFANWIRDESSRPGFDLVVAQDDDNVIGFAYGYRMPAGEWWHRTDRPGPPEAKATEKLAVMEWAVLPEHRGAGVGRKLMDELLTGRPERWATLTVNPAAEARRVYERWGWKHVASTKAGRMPAMDVMLIEMPSGNGEDSAPRTDP